MTTASREGVIGMLVGMKAGGTDEVVMSGVMEGKHLGAMKSMREIQEGSDTDMTVLGVLQACDIFWVCLNTNLFKLCVDFSL